MLDGGISLDEIKERFEAEFPPQKITLEELQQFWDACTAVLVVADVAGQGRQLRSAATSANTNNGSRHQQHPLHPLQGF